MLKQTHTQSIKYYVLLLFFNHATIERVYQNIKKNENVLQLASFQLENVFAIHPEGI